MGRMDVPCRLQKFLTDCGLSKKEICQKLGARVVTYLSGETGEEAKLKAADADLVIVFPGDKVIVDNIEVVPLSEQQRVCLAIYKPKNLDCQMVELKVPPSNISQLSRPESMHAWIERLSAKYQVPRLYPVGRLDKKTTGLMFVTNDGDLSTLLCQPGAIQKEYIVTTNSRPSEEQMAKLLAGVNLEDGPAKLDDVEVVEVIEVLPRDAEEAQAADQGNAPDQDVAGSRPTKKQKKGSTKRINLPPGCRPPKLSVKIRVKISIGRNRIVRRLLASVGLPVHHLHRSRIGTFSLEKSFPSLSPGKDVLLHPVELAKLWEEVGGKQEIRQSRMCSLQSMAESLHDRGPQRKRLLRWLAEHRSLKDQTFSF